MGSYYVKWVGEWLSGFAPIRDLLGERGAGGSRRRVARGR